MRNLNISRRAFLRLILLGGIGLSAATLNKVTQPVGPLTYLRWASRGQMRQRFGEPVPVALAKCPSYDVNLDECLADLWRTADIPDVRGKRVLVKPNLVDHIDGFPLTTAPEVVAAVIDLLRDLGVSEITVGDGPAFRREAEPVVTASGLGEILAKRRIPFVDLNYDDPAPIPLQDGWFSDHKAIWLPRHVREADVIISVPKLKTHHWAEVSLSMKNLVGVVPGARYGWPKNIVHVNGIIPSIMGIYQTLPPVIAVVDGITGMEGDGPLMGTPVDHGLLAVGYDPVAVDTLCASLMGFNVEEVPHLAIAAWAGLGQAQQIDIRGTDPAQLQQHYERPPALS